MRPRTRETYESQLNRLLPTFAGRELSSITPAEVRTWHGRISREGLHRNTVEKLYRLLRSIMSTAVDDGQKFYMSLWSPGPNDVAMRVCHELVTYANEIDDFPATQIAVTEKTYLDLEWSRDLVSVDDTGSCVAMEV